MAIFVGLVGGMTWSVLAYIIHLLRVPEVDQPEDGLHFETQALLRNNSSSLATFGFKALKVGISWEKVLGKRRTLTAVALASLAFTIYGSFVAVGLLLAGIAKRGNVLLDSVNCGQWNQTAIQSASATAFSDFLIANRAMAS